MNNWNLLINTNISGAARRLKDVDTDMYAW